MIAPATLLAFAALVTLLCMIPGPAVMITVSTALRRGVTGGFAAACGILAGNTVYFVLSAFGVAALVLASHEIFTVVKWAGAAYLAYLGIRSLLTRPHGLAPLEAPVAAVDVRSAFTSAIVTQLSSPKALIFFVAVIPQFVNPRGNLALQVAELAAISLVAELTVLSGYVAAAAKIRRTGLAGRATLWIERAGGAVLLAIAARIASEPLAAR